MFRYDYYNRHLRELFIGMLSGNRTKPVSQTEIQSIGVCQTEHQTLKYSATDWNTVSQTEIQKYQTETQSNTDWNNATRIEIEHHERKRRTSRTENTERHGLKHRARIKTETQSIKVDLCSIYLTIYTVSGK